MAEDSRQRIIDAAIREFAREGYAAASTNAITEAAGLSKGLLFHYFESKKQLYLFLVEYAVDHYRRRFHDRVGQLHPDIMERLLQVGRERVAMAREDPVLHKLYTDAFLKAPDEIRSELSEISRGVQAHNMRRLLEGIDMSKFRDDIDPGRAVALVSACLKGLGELYHDRAPKLEEAESILGELKDFLKMLKHGVYKPEVSDTREVVNEADSTG